MVRSLNVSSFPFDARESPVSPPEWFALPFSDRLHIRLYAELGMAELRLPSKYVEKGKHSAQRTFHPTTKDDYGTMDIITISDPYQSEQEENDRNFIRLLLY